MASTKLVLVWLVLSTCTRSGSVGCAAYTPELDVARGVGAGCIAAKGGAGICVSRCHAQPPHVRIYLASAGMRLRGGAAGKVIFGSGLTADSYRLMER